MAETSPRMQWVFPGQDEDPWFDRFVDFVRAMDASAFAAREDRNLIVAGGGTIAWDLATQTLSWSAPLVIASPTTGFMNRVPAGSIVLANGQFFRVRITRAPGANVDVLAQSAAATAEANNDSLILAFRYGDQIYWRNNVSPSSGAAPSGGGTQAFIWRPGGVAADNVYTDFDLLKAAVNAVDPQDRIVYVDESLDFPVIPAGTHDISGWTFRSFGVGFSGAPGKAGPAITAGDGVFLTFDDSYVVLMNVALEASGTGGTALISQADNTQITMFLFNSYIQGSNVGSGQRIMDLEGSLGNNKDAEIYLYDGAEFSSHAARVHTNGSLYLYAYGEVDIQTLAIQNDGDGTVEISLLDANYSPGSAAESLFGASPYTRSLGVRSEFIYYDDTLEPVTSLVPISPSSAQKSIDRQKLWEWGSAGVNTTINGPLNEQQVGTTELWIGSVWLTYDTRLRADSRAMLGALDPAHTAYLRLRQNSGGALIATWSKLGLAGNASLGADVLVADEGWYDLYLSCSDVAGTAIIKGLRLNAIPSGAGGGGGN